MNKIDVSTEEKKQEVVELFKTFTKKGDIYEHYHMSDSSRNKAYLDEIADAIGFDYSYYKEKRKAMRDASSDVEPDEVELEELVEGIDETKDVDSEEENADSESEGVVEVKSDKVKLILAFGLILVLMFVMFFSVISH